MDDPTDKLESKLIDRLASTTTSLRNLFYANLILASAILYLVYHDPGFVSERIGPALQTLEPIFKVYRYVKDNPTRFRDYRQNLDRTLELTDAAALALYQKETEIEKMEEAERDAQRIRLEERVNETERDALDSLVEGHKSIATFLVFDQDLKSAEYLKVFGLAVFLYADYWLPIVQKMRDLLIRVDDVLPGALPNRRELAGMNLSLLSLKGYNDVLKDATLGFLLDDLPPASKLYESTVVIETFCKANGLGVCSVQDIEKWQAKQGADAPPGKLGTSGIEVNVTRGLIVPASPIILLISQHVFIMLFRRREALRQQLSTGLSKLTLNLLDEPWIPDNITLNTSTLKSHWRRVQSLLMTAFLLVGEMAPLVAVVAVAYYTYEQVVLGAVTAKEFAAGMADFKEEVGKMGVVYFPSIPEVPGVFSEYVWFAVSVVCGLVLLVSLVQLIRDQVREVLSAEEKGQPVPQSVP